MTLPSQTSEKAKNQAQKLKFPEDKEFDAKFLEKDFRNRKPIEIKRHLHNFFFNYCCPSKKKQRDRQLINEGMKLLDKEMDILRIIRDLRATSVSAFSQMSYAQR